MESGTLTLYNSTIADGVASAGAGGAGGSAGGAGIAASSQASPGFGGRGGYGGYGGFYQAPNGQTGASGVLGHDGTSGLPGTAGASGSAGSGGGVYLGGGAMTLYNVTVALNSSGTDVGDGFFEVGGDLTAYNSLFANNGYSGAGTGPTGADFDNAASGTGSAVVFNGLLQSNPVGVTNGGATFVRDAGLNSAGLQGNGGPTIGAPTTSAPTETIALLTSSQAIGAGQNPIDNVTLFTDQRGYVPTGSWSVGAYQPGVPAAGPTASLSASNIAVGDYGAKSYTFTITYASAAAISAASLAGSVVDVIPPTGLGGPITATVAATVANGPTDPWGDAQSFTVTYTITPPGGSWTSADNGTYSISLGGSPISDINGTPVPTGTVGTFSVGTASINVARFGLILNHHTGLFSGTVFFTNTGTSAFTGPLFLVFNNLTSGAILENATGTFGGNFYLEINVGTIVPGQTVSATVVFNKSLVSYTPELFLGGLGL